MALTTLGVERTRVQGRKRGLAWASSGSQHDGGEKRVTRRRAVALGGMGMCTCCAWGGFVGPMGLEDLRAYKRFQAEAMEQGMEEYERELEGRKAATFSPLRGLDEVCEIGVGAWPNARHYSRGQRVIGIDPNEEMLPLAQRRAEEAGVELDWRHGTAERLSLPAQSVDAVACTLVLCSGAHSDQPSHRCSRCFPHDGSFPFGS